MKSQCQHAHICSSDRDIQKITAVFILITMFLVLEIWGHIKTGSLSLLADALHLTVDIAGFIVSIITLRLSKKGSTPNMTFGYERVEVIGALFSVFFIWSAVVYLMVESFHKYWHPIEIDGKVFLQVSIAGLIVNLICMAILHYNPKHRHEGEKENLNMRATYIHVIGDIIQSIGVIIASTIIYFFKNAVIADVLCTLFFAMLVFYTTVYVVRDAIKILIGHLPKDINSKEIKQKILSIDRVMKVIDFKCWSLSVNSNCIAVKILVDDIHLGEYERIIKEIKHYLEVSKGIDFVNIQIDTKLANKELFGFEVNGIPIETIQ